MKLYHVFLLDDELRNTREIECTLHTFLNTEFIPNIPESNVEGVDRTIPRICLSHSPWGLLASFDKLHVCYTKQTIHRGKQPAIPMIIAAVNTESLIPEKLWPADRVQNYIYDACSSDEIWYLAPIKFSGVQYCELRTMKTMDCWELLQFEGASMDKEQATLFNTTADVLL